MPAVVARNEANDEIVKRVLDNEEFGDAVREHPLSLVYTRMRDAA